MTNTLEKTHSTLKKMFKPGRELTYAAVAERLSLSTETIRRNAIKLAKMKKLTRTNGKITKVN